MRARTVITPRRESETFRRAARAKRGWGGEDLMKFRAATTLSSPPHRRPVRLVLSAPRSRVSGIRSNQCATRGTAVVCDASLEADRPSPPCPSAARTLRFAWFSGSSLYDTYTDCLSSCVRRQGRRPCPVYGVTILWALIYTIRPSVPDERQADWQIDK